MVVLITQDVVVMVTVQVLVGIALPVVDTVQTVDNSILEESEVMVLEEH